MANLVRVGIAGTGSYVPDRVVPNAHFEAFLDTSDEWIVQRTGIKNRRWAAPGQQTSQMATAAARKACEMAKVKPEELDLIVLGTLTPDHLLPSTSSLVQRDLGAVNAATFDVNAACTGFLTAMSAGEAFIASGRYKRVLAIGAETLSRFLDFKDRGSCILFGDGAGAALLTPWDDCRQGEILKSKLGADGRGYELIHMRAGGSARPASHATVDAGEHFIRVQGREVFRFAVERMGTLLEEMVDGYPRSEVCVVVPHQVNRRIIDAALERMGWTDEKVVVNIQDFGNTSAASVPIALDQAVRTGRMEKGKLVIIVAFGAGLTWGAALVRW